MSGAPGYGECAARIPGLTRETYEKLCFYVAALKQYNAHTNLVSPATLGDVWERHIYDSLQLLPHIEGAPFLDIGAGAGLPGLVLALAGCPGYLVESIQKKALFLENVARETGAPASVVNARVEDIVFDESLPAYLTTGTTLAHAGSATWPSVCAPAGEPPVTASPGTAQGKIAPPCSSSVPTELSSCNSSRPARIQHSTRSSLSPAAASSTGVLATSQDVSSSQDTDISEYLPARSDVLAGGDAANPATSVPLAPSAADSAFPAFSAQPPNASSSPASQGASGNECVVSAENSMVSSVPEAHSPSQSAPPYSPASPGASASASHTHAQPPASRAPSCTGKVHTTSSASQASVVEMSDSRDTTPTKSALPSSATWPSVHVPVDETPVAASPASSAQSPSASLSSASQGGSSNECVVSAENSDVSSVPEAHSSSQSTPPYSSASAAMVQSHTPNCADHDVSRETSSSCRTSTASSISQYSHNFVEGAWFRQPLSSAQLTQFSALNVSRETFHAHKTDVRPLHIMEKPQILRPDLVTARAVAPLTILMGYAIHILRPNGSCVFLKGKTIQEEIRVAQKKWRFDYELFPSQTSPDGHIIKINNIKRRHEDHSPGKSKRRRR